MSVILAATTRITVAEILDISERSYLNHLPGRISIPKESHDGTTIKNNEPIISRRNAINRLNLETLPNI